jgi:nucleoside-diphosphate-sugar epimerase
MQYVLITGVTGLVGRHVLRELLNADVRVAVMVRPVKGPKIIEGIIQSWERELGRTLPRPIIIEGDLFHPEVVPDERQRRWLTAYCDSILHCAASISFKQEKNGDPGRTNVEGTKALLELCRVANIRKFHQVSTAYVCGLRQGTILESELDMGHTLADVYQISKLEAEKLIHAARFLDQVTVYRPPFVLGHSESGYVTSYHGFYALVQLANGVAEHVPVSEMNSRFAAVLGLDGTEGRTIVPVDWLSKSIAYLLMHPEHHGRTYHLTNEVPVPVAEMQRATRDAVKLYCKKPLATAIDEEQLAFVERAFKDVMRIYEGYWRDDPRFDMSNTRAALPNFPPPVVDYDMLMRAARYSIEHNFLPPRHDPKPLEYDVSAHLAGRFKTAAGTPDGEQFGLQVNGSGGGHWNFRVIGNRIGSYDWGLPQAPAACFYLNSATFRALANNELTVQECIYSGRLMMEGSAGLDRLIHVFESLVSAGEGIRPAAALSAS